MKTRLNILIIFSILIGISSCTQTEVAKEKEIKAKEFKEIRNTAPIKESSVEITNENSEIYEDWGDEEDVFTEYITEGVIGTDTLAISIQRDTYQKVSDIPLPQGYTRNDVDTGSFAFFLRNFPIRQGDTIVNLFDGVEKYYQYGHFVILDMEVGDKDLQQCADAIMRLKAEYHFQRKEFEAIHFDFTNGETVGFPKYAKGQRPISFKGSKTTWSQKASEDYSYATFEQYMQLIYMFAGTLSLSKELNKVNSLDDMEIGDIFMYGGTPGHAEIVIDVAVHEQSGKKIFMLAQSFMPAQDVHIVLNSNVEYSTPWYSQDFGDILETPSFSFGRNELMRF